MEVRELKGDLDELYRSRSSYWVPNFKSFCTRTTEWKLGPIFTERETYDDDDDDDIYHDLITRRLVYALRRKIPNDPDDTSSTKPHKGSTRTSLEWVNLRNLTERGCTCTPRLLDINDPVPSGFIFFIVMERLPRRNLVNFADLPMSERDQVRLAFVKAIREFYSFKFVHRDPDRRNLMWDPENKKCYIIDLEDAHQINDSAEPKKFIPEKDFYS
ncbi:hypothetical protein AJ80_04528 [Polytolypa hystricis UAMH7299]|uniref:Uncharacterized protein n=1 Tax=Polytolypa hystricis (strain UAMH7299) TaxID=1447883 RepID=A0A2B7YAY6_POLH7|nr:hypothetical protein AJ80_04528 [Polytolypa hystricis UAMH7299]